VSHLVGDAVRDRRLHGALGKVAKDPFVVVRRAIAFDDHWSRSRNRLRLVE
jgi:hypothetical protein